MRVSVQTMKASLSCTIALLFLIGCNPITHFEQKKKRAIANCLTSIPYAVEFSKCFPQSHLSLTRFMDSQPLQTFNMEAPLYQRYIIRMQVPVTLDQSRTNLVRFGVPKFVLDKVESISTEEDGRYSIRFNSDSEISTAISLAEWKKIVESRGDVTVLDRPIIKDQPVAGFSEYWKNKFGGEPGQLLKFN